MSKTVSFVLSMILIFTTTANTSKARENKKHLIIEAIQQTNFDRAVLDICIANTSLCKILTDRRIYTYLRKHHKRGLYAIAFKESSFKYKIGFRNKHDRGYFQINTKIWSPKVIREKFGIPTTIWSLTHNPYIQAKVALRVWLYNTALFLKTYRKYPKNLAEYASLYHNPSKISRKYAQKIKKVIFKTR